MLKYNCHLFIYIFDFAFHFKNIIEFLFVFFLLNNRTDGLLEDPEPPVQ